MAVGHEGTKVEECICGACDGSGEIEHKPDESAMRLTCPCGISSPWEHSFATAYRSWNALQVGLQIATGISGAIVD
jgi:hypothetical protein